MAPTTNRKILRAVLPWIIVAVAAFGGMVLVKTAPSVPRSNPPPVAAAVGVAALERQAFPVFIEAFGSVIAARQTALQPEVGGRVTHLHGQLLPGGLLKEGGVLFKIDDADYKIRLAEAQGELDAARIQIDRLGAGVAVLRSRVRQVEADLEYLSWNMKRLDGLRQDNQASEAEALEARARCLSQEAQLSAIQAQILEQEHTVEAARAQLRIAQSRVETARLALARTEVTVPFDAIVLSENVEVGQLINPQTPIVTLAATDEFWVEAAVPVGRLQDITFSDGDSGNGSDVQITLVTGSAEILRSGVVLRPLGQLDPEGRMARILVAIRDPLNLAGDGDGGRQAIRMGSYVRLAIDAGTLQDVFAIPRYALRENNRVWVRDDSGRLNIRDVDIVWRRQDDVLVRNGFQEGDQLVTTHLASVVPGMPLDVRAPEDESTESHLASEQP